MSELTAEKVEQVLRDSRLGLDSDLISSEALKRIASFCALLEKWNRKINLTSENEASSILETHVFDSLQYLRWLAPGQRVIDIGSGGGFPGIPVKIMLPEIDLVLLESQRKRCSFLREAVRLLNLGQIEVAEGRAEELRRQETLALSFDRALFRGFSSLSQCLSAGLPFLKMSGRLILMKDPQEIEDMEIALPKRLKPVEKLPVFSWFQRESQMLVIEKCST